MKVLAEVYRFHFHNERRERLFLASLAFLLTFGIVRAITISIRAGIGPFQTSARAEPTSITWCGASRF